MTDITKIDAFVESCPHPAWLATARGECLYVNPSLERLIGLKSDQINQVDWRTFVLEEDRAGASASWESSLASGTPYRKTVRLRRFDGVPATVELLAFGHTLKDGTELWLFTGLHVLASTQHYPRLEAQLQATLNVIPAYTWYALPSGALTFVNERTADYLGLPKDHPLRFGIDTGAEWDAHIPLLHPDDREESRRIPIECRFEDCLPVVHADQIQQVFINLIVALEEQKVGPLIVLRATADANRMLIQVIDDGPGVDDPDRIFEAFMTTKGNGMGIGLAVSRTIVESHGGQLWAENNQTGGATFNVALPLSHASPMSV